MSSVLKCLTILGFCLIACRAACDAPEEGTTTKTTTATMERICMSPDSMSFITSPSGKAFVPVGFNYDHDSDNRFIEDYWDDEWDTVVADFQEMRTLGANVVRLHSEFGQFMKSPTEVNEHAMEMLGRVVKLAEETGLYLDITGLACYRKPRIPDWYDPLPETERWEAQAVYWEAIAKLCADSTALFCYDLMNEPFVSRRKRSDWLGFAFDGESYFGQALTLDRGKREPWEVAVAWATRMKEAIRRHDPNGLITIGLNPYGVSLSERRNPFAASKLAPVLDFFAVHTYPRRKYKSEMKILKSYASRKATIIEEVFPLTCSAEELGAFIEASRPFCQGWIGFYWGEMPEESRLRGDAKGNLVADWLDLFRSRIAPLADNRP